MSPADSAELDRIELERDELHDVLSCRIQCNDDGGRDMQGKIEAARDAITVWEDANLERYDALQTLAEAEAGA